MTENNTYWSVNYDYAADLDFASSDYNFVAVAVTANVTSDTANSSDFSRSAANSTSDNLDGFANSSSDNDTDFVETNFSELDVGNSATANFDFLENEDFNIKGFKVLDFEDFNSAIDKDGNLVEFNGFSSNNSATVGSSTD